MVGRVNKNVQSCVACHSEKNGSTQWQIKRDEFLIEFGEFEVKFVII